MELTENEKTEISEILKKRNRFIWTEHILNRLFIRINKIRDGTLTLKDWYIKDYITMEEYLNQINLLKYTKWN